MRNYLLGILTVIAALFVVDRIVVTKEVIDPKNDTLDIDKAASEIVQRHKTRLGAVNRPNAEELEKKKNPRLQAEEEAWEEDIKKII